jgi:hypothetical protein
MRCFLLVFCLQTSIWQNFGVQNRHNPIDRYNPVAHVILLIVKYFVKNITKINVKKN